MLIRWYCEQYLAATSARDLWPRVEIIDGEMLVFWAIRQTKLHWNCKWFACNGSKDSSQRAKPITAAPFNTVPGSKMISRKLFCRVSPSCPGECVASSVVEGHVFYLNVAQARSFFLFWITVFRICPVSFYVFFFFKKICLLLTFHSSFDSSEVQFICTFVMPFIFSFSHPPSQECRLDFLRHVFHWSWYMHSFFQ
jgi:hypothetical protein